MPVSKTVKSLGRSRFENRTAAKSTPGWGANLSVTNARVLVAPFEVLYSPYKVPGWKQLIANHLDATSVLIGTKSSSKSTQFRCRHFIGYSGGATSEWTASGEVLASQYSIPVSSPSILPLAQQLAAEKFVSNYYKKTRSLRGASSIAEAASTIAGLASPAKALRNEVTNLYRSLSKRLYRSNGEQVKDAAKVVAGTWLEWKFGVEPLVSDVDGAATAVNKMREGNFNASVPVAGKGVDSFSYQHLYDQGFTAMAGMPSPGVINSYMVDETVCVIRGAVRVTPPGREVPPVQQFGVGIEDVLPAVWEGIPWSFFVDYFINVSSVIDAWSMLSCRIAWMNRTIRNRRTMYISDLKAYAPSGFPPNTYVRSTAMGGHAEASFITTIRSKANWDDLVPSLRIKLPISGTKWANISALAAMFTPPKGDASWFRLPPGSRRRLR